jgi:uncharacterized protein (DUF885 family)
MPSSRNHPTLPVMARLLLVQLLALLAGPLAASPADEKLDTLMAEVWQAELRDSPLMASIFGATGNRDKVDDLSEPAIEARRQRLDAAIVMLQAIDPASLTGANPMNYRVFEWMLRNERHTLDFDWHLVTLNSMGGMHSLFAQVVLATPDSTADDYRQKLQRMEAFGGMVDQLITRDSKAIAAGYAQPCEALAGFDESIIGWATEKPEDSPFYQSYAKLPERMDWAERSELQQQAKKVVGDSVNPAFERYYDFYKEQYEPNCRKSIGLSAVPRGAELYGHFVKFYTSLNTDPQRVHALGLAEVERIRNEMLSIKEQAGFSGSLAEFRKFLQTDPQFYLDDAEDYLQYVARFAKEADRRMPEFFAVLPRNSYGILPVPEQIAPKATTAYYQPGAADGSRAGVYFVNTYELASRPLYELPALTLHEGVPGHHHQISLAQEMPDLPDFRRMYYFHAFGEGWGLYTEKLGVEMGMYHTPYEHFGRLVYEMWRACRLVVDTGMHSKGWTRQQAIDYMVEFTGLTLQNITAEVNRYITYPGQALAYKHGELKFLELRQRAERALGDDFNLRQFHSALLGNGSLPLTILDEVMSDWIRQQAGND